jgi:hypothetical protein
VSNNLGWWLGSSDTILKENHLKTIPPKWSLGDPLSEFRPTTLAASQDVHHY